jgi:hypothetical protein
MAILVAVVGLSTLALLAIRFSSRSYFNSFATFKEISNGAFTEEDYPGIPITTKNK